MLFPTVLVSVSRQASSTPYLTGRQVYLHTRGLNEALQMLATGQPVHTFMDDNGGSPPAYSRGDVVTVTARLLGGTLPAITRWTIDDVESRGDLFGPYLEVQLTAVGR